METKKSLLALAADCAQMGYEGQHFPSWSPHDWEKVGGIGVMSAMHHLGMGAWFGFNCHEACLALTWAATVWDEAVTWPAPKRR